VELAKSLRAAERLLEFSAAPRHHLGRVAVRYALAQKRARTLAARIKREGVAAAERVRRAREASARAKAKAAAKVRGAKAEARYLAGLKRQTPETRRQEYMKGVIARAMQLSR